MYTQMVGNNYLRSTMTSYHLWPVVDHISSLSLKTLPQQDLSSVCPITEPLLLLHTAYIQYGVRGRVPREV